MESGKVYSVMIKLEEFYLLLLFQVESQEATTRKSQNMKRDFISCGKMFKGLGAQVIFFSIQPFGN